MRLINDHLYTLFVTLLLLIALSVWFALPLQPDPSSGSAATEAWALPTLPHRDAGKALATIAARDLWGAMAAAAAVNAPAPTPSWRILGIARNGPERFILMAYEGKPVAQLKVGDALPDGMTIVEIDDDRFLVKSDTTKKIVFGIYKNDEPKK